MGPVPGVVGPVLTPGACPGALPLGLVLAVLGRSGLAVAKGYRPLTLPAGVQWCMLVHRCDDCLSGGEADASERLMPRPVRCACICRGVLGSNEAGATSVTEASWLLVMECGGGSGYGDGDEMEMG